MGEVTGISWTDSTVNCWHGCDKVDTLCKHCYAEVSTPVRVKRAKGLEVWGPKAARSETKSWEWNLRKWNREAQASGKVHRVFGQSLSDTFEDRGAEECVVMPDGDRTTLRVLRAYFFVVIEECPMLTFQLLTKRPENVCRMVPASWLTSWPAHVQIGTSVGDQETAEKRIPHLLRVPAPVRFLSVEPQIGPVTLRNMVHVGPGSRAISWIIQGGESGSKARPFDLAWARSMREQCRAAAVPYFLKQLGAYARGTQDDHFYPHNYGRFVADRDRLTFADSHGGDENEWPADLRGLRAFPEARHA